MLMTTIALIIFIITIFTAQNIITDDIIKDEDEND